MAFDGARPMLRKDLLARFDALVAAANDHDTDRVVAAFSPEVRVRDGTVGRLAFGREAIRVDAETILDAWPELEVRSHHAVLTRGVIACEWTVSPSAPSRFTASWAGVLIADYDAVGQIRALVLYAAPSRAVGLGGGCGA